MKQKRHETLEYVLYIIFGGLTTLVNYIVYFGLKDGLHWHYTISNTLAFVVAVLFAFLTNKAYVFQSKSTHYGKEFLSFVSLRIVSMLIETALLVIGVEWLAIDEGWMKIVVSVLTVILNYFFGKYITFARKEAL